MSNFSLASILMLTLKDSKNMSSKLPQGKLIPVSVMMPNSNFKRPSGNVGLQSSNEFKPNSPLAITVFRPSRAV